MSRTALARRQFVLAGAASCLGLPTARAQTGWPTKPVTTIVPFPPGGGTDAFARPLFAAMSRNTGRQFVIANKGGAGGTLGAGLASRATADGYNFFMGAVHHAIAPSMYPKLDYDIEKDFIPVGLVSSVPQVIVVNPQKVQATNLAQFLEFVRRNPGRLNYGSGGNGSGGHLAGEMFKAQAKVFVVHIPYNGGAPAQLALLSGQVDYTFDNL
ncbi:MAG: Bug family tripartite tricarboxylate transporter substrate binding protein, partial [Rubrivivax sp.]